MPEGDDFSLNVYRSAKGEERSAIRYNAAARELSLEKGLTSQNYSVSKEILRKKINPAVNTGAAEEPIELRVFLDHSMVEIFANDEDTISGRLYPSLDDSDGISLSGKVEKLKVCVRRVTV